MGELVGPRSLFGAVETASFETGNVRLVRSNSLTETVNRPKAPFIGVSPPSAAKERSAEKYKRDIYLAETIRRLIGETTRLVVK